MLPFKECKRKLSNGKREYNDSEVEMIRKFLWELANENVNQIIAEIEQDEKCRDNGKGKF